MRFVPQALQGESGKRLLQGVVAGAVLTMIVGFSWGGWVTGGTAKKMVADSTNEMAVSLYTPTCVENFEKQADLPNKWIAFKKVETYMRDSYIREAGFATVPGAGSPNSEIADKCAEALTKIADKQSPSQAKN